MRKKRRRRNTEIDKRNRECYRYLCNEAENDRCLVTLVLTYSGFNLATLLHNLKGLCQMRTLDGKTNAAKQLPFSALLLKYV